MCMLQFKILKMQNPFGFHIFSNIRSVLLLTDRRANLLSLDPVLFCIKIQPVLKIPRVKKNCSRNEQ